MCSAHRTPELYRPGPADPDSDGELIDREAGEPRAGRLVSPDYSAESNSDDLVADDGGIDGAAASAEEARPRIEALLEERRLPTSEWDKPERLGDVPGRSYDCWTLVELDDGPARTRLAQAEASLAVARANADAADADARMASLNATSNRSAARASFRTRPASICRSASRCPATRSRRSARTRCRSRRRTACIASA